MTRYALTAIGRDRPGIVAAVTKALYKHRCNIEDSSMVRLAEEFAVILLMAAPGRDVEEGLRKDLEKVEKEMGLAVTLRRISARAALGKEEMSNYIITLHGADKAGIVYKTTEALAAMGMNITDLETEMVGGKKKIYIMLLEVRAPRGLSMKKTEEKLKRLAARLGVTIRIKPIEAYDPL